MSDYEEARRCVVLRNFLTTSACYLGHAADVAPLVAVLGRIRASVCENVPECDC